MMDQSGRMDGYRDTGLDSSYSSSFEQDDVNYPAAAPPTLGDLFRCPRPKSSAASPTTPLAFGGAGRQSSYSRRQSINDRMPKLNDPTDRTYTPPTALINPSTFGNPARMSSYANSQSINGEVTKLHDNIANSNASSPLAFGSPGRTSPYARSPARSPSMSGRIQKPSSGRTPAFRGTKGAKLGQRSHQMDSLQSQLYNEMRTVGVDHSKIVHWLESLKDLYLNRDEQQQQESGTNSRPESPLVDGSQPPRIVEDPPVHASIALLKHKFAQLERFKESTHGQQIPLYLHQHYHKGLSPGQRTPASPSSCSPRVGPSSESSPDSSYEFDETTAALLALQQEMNYHSARSSPSGTSESIGSRSPNWYAASDSPRSSLGSRGDEANHALPAYPKLRPVNVGRQSNLGAFQESSLRGAPTGNMAFGGPNEVSLESLFAAEKMEAAAKITNSQKKSASSIEMAMSKLSFSLTPKLSSPRGKTQRSCGTGLSGNTPFLTDRTGGKVRGSEVPETWSNASDVQSLYNRVECPEDIRIEHEELVDTSLRL